MKLSDCKHGSIVKVGSHEYRLYRLEQFADGTLGTMRRYARLQPVIRKETGFWDDHKYSSWYKDWEAECELVDDTDTAAAGEKLVISQIDRTI